LTPARSAAGIADRQPPPGHPPDSGASKTSSRRQPESRLLSSFRRNPESSHPLRHSGGAWPGDSHLPSPPGVSCAGCRTPRLAGDRSRPPHARLAVDSRSLSDRHRRQAAATRPTARGQCLPRVIQTSYSFEAPSTLLRCRSNVPSGRCPALRASSTSRQSEKPRVGCRRNVSSAAAAASGSWSARC